MIGTSFFDIQLIDPTLAAVGTYIDDDAGVCNVLTAGSAAEATIYSDNQGTAASNPLTFTDGRIKFWTDSTVTTVDLCIMTNSGQAVYKKSVNTSMHRICIDTDRRNQTLFVPFGAQTSETDTGFDFPANCAVEDCYLYVTTVDATETLDVGILSSETGGDANGFLAATSVATAGVADAYATVNNGSTSDYFDSGTYGVFLASQINGSDAAATSGGQTRAIYRTDGTAKSITYTGSAGSDTAAGFIVFRYTLLG